MLVFNSDINPQDMPLRDIIQFAETQAVTTHIVKEYLVARLLEDDNVLAQVCEQSGSPGPSLRAAALADIQTLMPYCETGNAILDAYMPSVKRQMHFAAYQQSIEAIVAQDSSEGMLDGIIRHYCRFGGGKGGKHIAFIWDNGLHGIEKPDGVTMDSLYCLSAQKKELAQNTEAFIKGLPRNNCGLPTKKSIWGQVKCQNNFPDHE